MSLTNLLKADSLPSWFPLHHFLDSTPYVYETPGSVRLVDWNQASLWAAVGMVLFNPIFWNIVARNGKWILSVMRTLPGGGWGGSCKRLGCQVNTETL